MSWIDDTRTDLAQSAGVGYRLGGTPASEPTALAAMALLAGGSVALAETKLRWLADLQAAWTDTVPMIVLGAATNFVGYADGVEGLVPSADTVILYDQARAG